MQKNLFIALIAGIVSINASAQQLTGGLQSGSLPWAPSTMQSMVCDTIFSFPTLVGWSSGLASDGTNLWVSSYNVPYLSKFSSTGVLLDTLEVPNPLNKSTLGGDIDFDGTNILFGREDDGTLYKINPVTKTLVAQIQLPQYSSADPNDFGIAFDGTYIWHTAYSPINTLYKLDANTGAVITSFPIDGGADLPLKFINGNLYTIDVFNATAIQLDTATGFTLNVIPWCLTYPLGFAQHNGHLWGLASNFANRVYEFDTLLMTAFTNPQPAGFHFTINNPVNDKLIVHLQNKISQPASLYITDMQGRTVMQQSIPMASTKTEIPVGGLLNGLYFVKVQSGNAVAVKKVVVN